MRSRKISFLVEFTRPKGATVDECRTYIDEAVTTWRGQLRPVGGLSDEDPGDPMWSLEPDTVKVRQHIKPKEKIIVKIKKKGRAVSVPSPSRTVGHRTVPGQKGSSSKPRSKSVPRRRAAVR